MDGVDVSAILRGGVYALVAGDVVEYIGRAKCFLPMLEAHRGNPKALPFGLPTHKIRYDKILVYPCHPDRVAALELEMIHRYQPRYNILASRSKSCVA